MYIVSLKQTIDFLNKTILKVISELRSNESERNWTRELTESILKVNAKSSTEAFSNKHFASSNFLLLPKVFVLVLIKHES